MRLVWMAAAAASLVIGGNASAQTSYNEPGTTGSVRQRAAYTQASGPQQGQYGGGFIELLLTGRNPGTPVRAMPARSAAVLYGAPPPSVHGYEPHGHGRGFNSPRLAALPGTPDAGPVGIGRVLDPRFERQVVDYDGRHAPGTIVIDTSSKFLYLVQPSGKAMRYGIGVGRPGFEWAGTKSVTMKREWPDWRPPPEMLKRRPDLPRYMAGGPDNPLGARALYLGSSLYRIHGTNEPHTIGQAVSSGCIRMTNDDVMHLYERVKVGATVVVI